MALTKVSGDILDTGIVVAGVTTSTNFKTGTSNLHSAGLEVAGINVLGADTPIGAGVTIYNSGGADFTGVVTATKFVGQVDITGGSASFSGNVSIGGTLTYEDVTNIDSVGLVTARNGLKVLAGGANVVGVVTATSFVGSGANLTGIDATKIITGNTEVQTIDTGSDGAIKFITEGTEKARIRTDGNLGLGIDNPLTKIHAYGSTPTITFRDNNANATFVGGAAAGDAYVGSSSNHPFLIKSNNTEKLRITSAGNLSLGNDGSFPIYTDTNDRNFILGTGSDDTAIQIHSGSDKYGGLYFGDATSGGDRYRGYVEFKHGTNDDYLRFAAGGTERIRLDKDGHLTPAAAGTQDLGSTSKEFRNLYIGDSGKIYLGSDQDSYIYHNGSNHYITNTNGNLILDNSGGVDMYINSGNDIYIRPQGTENGIKVIGDGAVELYHNGSTYTTPKIKTSTTGVTVDGEVAASQDYPNYRPMVDWNFAAVKKLDPRITYYRSGPASYTDEFGIVKKVGDNTPRFDHDPITRESKGLLIEETRTNQMINSSDITGATAQNGTITGNATTAPDGTTTADKYAANSTNGLHRVDLPFTSGQISNSTAYTFSVFVKANGYDKLHIRYGGYNADNHGLGYDLSDGTTFAGKYDGTSALGAVTSSSMIEYPNDWYRCSFTVTTAADAGSGVAQMFYYISNSESTTNFAGDGSSGMYFWGAQMEVGSFPTSLIPTNGATATRGLDLTTVEGTEFSDIFDTDFKQFSMVADYDNTTTPDGNNYGIIDLWGEATDYNNRIEWFKDNASPYHIETRGKGSGTSLFNDGALAASSKAKAQRFASSWYVPDYSNTTSRRFVVSMGGEAVDVVADGSGTGVPQLTRLGIGCNPTRLDFSGGVLHFKRLMFYNRTLSDGQLQNLSAQ